SQYEEPFSTDGCLDIDVDGVHKRVGITRVHMEEDAGKNVHGVGGDSLVNLNRAGVPLIEIVGEPDLRSSAEAVAYLRAVREILVFIGVNDGNLEEGSFRCDANVSIRPRGAAEFGTRCELKNINSFRFVQRAIEAEVARQTSIVDAGGRIRQETRSFDPDTGQTSTLRSKEEAHDYRYFPEPDLPALRIQSAFIADCRRNMPELPGAVRARWHERGIAASTSHTLSQHPGYVRFFEAVCETFPQPVKAANFVANDVLRGAHVHGLSATFSVTPSQVAELLTLVESGEISGKQAKEVFAAIEGSDKRPQAVVEERGMRVVSNQAELRALCEALIAQFPNQAASVRSGKKGVLGFFVGQAMKETRGSADPKLVSDLLESLLVS
ncbi:MAG TPA: Asp-tRNA(Asn)/Glu-tRNA(Gln) amidotransferase subunit GatB, partial [Polyangiaceae bacterium]|nr:Asp-tRNA(Asn)/Glu-tRNA(Gln) amidotransferase subunit GatB [Polyangiaceae bacterium]